MRELIARMTELVMVGQPDLRAGATLGIYQLAVACAERTVELETKLATAERQYKASKGQARKLQALKHNMDTWRRHKEELEERLGFLLFLIFPKTGVGQAENIEASKYKFSSSLINKILLIIIPISILGLAVYSWSFSDFTYSSLSLTELPSLDRSLVLLKVLAFVLFEP